MYVVRSVEPSDLPVLFQLASQAGRGIMTFPANKTLLQQRIDKSLASFSKKVTSPGEEYYYFVIEDTSQHQVVGCSALLAFLGFNQPYYFYKVLQWTMTSKELNLVKQLHFLNITNDHEGASELSTLYLDPAHRIQDNGRLLSLSRFLFVANQPQRFSDHIIAELRGVFDESDKSPFWKGLSQHFLGMNFSQVMLLMAQENRQFIHDLIPSTPICIELLPQEVQCVIGIPHEQGVPAKALLESEGFSYQGYVDLFDGGPTLEIQTKKIRTIKKSKIGHVAGVKEEIVSIPYLISNVHSSFRATIGCLEIDENQNAKLSSHIAKQLQVMVHDEIRFVPLRS